MTVDPAASDPGRAPDGTSPGRAGEPDRLRSGRVAELVLVAAGLGLMIYLLGFVDDVATGALVGPLLLGGGLLAASAVLPTAGPRVLAPAAVATGTGALLLLQAVVGGNDSAGAIAALVLAVLQAVAAGGAALLQAGAVRLPPRRPRRARRAAPPPYAYPPPGYPAFPNQQYPGQQYPGQQYPGQPYPGQPYPGQPYPGSYPGHPAGSADPYAGEHAYAQYAQYGTPYGVPGYPPPPPAGPASVGPPAERPPPGDAPTVAAPTVVAPDVVARPAEPVDPTSAAYGDVPGRADGPGVPPDTSAVPRTGSSSRAPEAPGTPPVDGPAEDDDRRRAVRRAPGER